MNEIANELAAALRNLLDQTYQMSSMFTDGDQTIANSVSDAEEVLRRYSKLRLTSTT